MKKIRLLCSISGPAGMFPAGSELETTEKEADSMVMAGYALYIEEEPSIDTAGSKNFAKRETTDGRLTRKRRK